MVKRLTRDDLKVGFLGDDDISRKTVQDEEPVKVTILLPKDTLDMIDAMVRNAMVGSRGRLIQLLIDDIWSLHSEYNFLNEAMDAAADPKRDTHEVIIRLAFGVGNMLRRLARYYAIKKTDDRIEKT